MSAYYNEIDPYAAQWLRNLEDSKAPTPGLLPPASAITPTAVGGPKA